ncbi:PREDICTED: probable G-protein coupled receptor 34 [Thamnophis sirtalis]|uniref:Probable G-protein coupled receptor 34 n=1 Tax=Thamnophis sirtalis TaxID=35019 RepID=A0A6I9Z1J7_9SAUR|nr:PREDICTED: probable G-protein coupled receptor 34 [Thamnophis sirtalis]
MDIRSFLDKNLHNGSNLSSNESTCGIQDGFLMETLPAMYSIIAVIGFVSNLLALWVFTFGPLKTNSITVYMKQLAIADLLLALCLPFRAAYQKHNGPPALCQMVGMIFYITMYVSILFLSLISLDRYFKIIKPLQQFRIHTTSFSVAMSVVVWVLCFVTMLCFLLDTSKSGPCEHRCFHFKYRTTSGGVLNMLAVIFFFLLLFFFLYSYGKISLRLHAVSLKKTQQRSKKMSTRIVIKTFVVLVVFFVCFVPYHVVRIPYVLAQMRIISEQNIQALHVANELVLCISTLNCCFDPVIFFFLSSSFKRSLLDTTVRKLKWVSQNNQRVLYVK